MAAKVRTVEQKIAGMADRQHGVVTRVQVLRAGVSRNEIERCLKNGILLRVYPGVYRVGHRAPSLEAGYLAAAFACGEGAVLSGEAAAYLWSILKGKPPPPEVTAPTERRVKGVKTSRSRLQRWDRAVHRGTPVTTVAATIVDLAPRLTLHGLALVCHEAGVKYGTTPRQVDAAMRRRYRPAGSSKLRHVIHGDVKVALSTLERRFLELLEEHGLPLPQTNKVASGRRVDCRWPEQKVTVELDSYTFHRSRYAWEQDRRREREAYARGDEFRRYTWGDVFDEPRLMLRELKALTAHRSGEYLGRTG